MRVVLRLTTEGGHERPDREDGEREVEVIGIRADTTLRDVLTEAGVAPSGGDQVRVDGRVVNVDHTPEAAGVLYASIIHIGPPDQSTPPVADPPPGGFELAVVGGLDSGARYPLPGWGVAVTVGRGEGADLRIGDATVSPSHAVLQAAAGGPVATVRDLGSHNGTVLHGHRIGGEVELAAGALLELGASQLVVRPVVGAGAWATSHAVATGLRRPWTVPFNRPPRRAAAGPADEVPVPDPPAPGRGHAAFSVIALLGPLAMAVVMVQLLGNIRYALFALMSPLMMISNHLAGRRRAAREHRRSTRRFREAVARFEEALGAAADHERARRRRQTPDLAEILRRAASGSARLWERRPDHADHLLLRVGRGPVSWRPPVDDRQAQSHPDIGAAIARASVMRDCPVQVDLSGGAVAGVVGHRRASLAVVRSLVVQACVLHGPADMRLAVFTTPQRAVDWQWVTWLPHTTAVCDGEPVLSADSAASAGWLERLTAAEAPSARTLLVVFDDEALVQSAPARGVLRGVAGPVAGVVVATTAQRLPAVCGAVVELVGDLGAAVVHRPAAGESDTDVVVTGLSDANARAAARGLARLDDLEFDPPGVGVPHLVTLSDVLGPIDPAAVVGRWVSPGAEARLRVPVGIGSHGPVEIDLVHDGPHALVGGTTGAGKSEFLRSLLAGLAVTASPEHLTFVLIDYKGGSAFDECARLPHTVGLVTDLDGHLGERALVSMDAELRHRERTLRAAGAADVGEYLRLGAPCGPMPRLLVVVDEFATLAAELPDFMGALVGIAQRGRSLGVHMVLATQRPSGVVNANIKANTAVRVALRVQDGPDSTDIIDRPDAAAIPRNAPGRAFVRLGPGEIQTVQTPYSGASVGRAAGERPTVRTLDFGAVDPAQEVTVDPGLGPSDLTRVVQACVEAFEKAGSPRPRRPWLDMLPTRIGPAALAGEPTGSIELRSDDPGASPLSVPIALADDPAHQCRSVVAWTPGQGHLALIGAVGSGTTSALVASALAAAGRAAPAALHVYAIDFGGGGLTPLARLPHASGVVSPGETERLARMISRLAAEVTSRRSASEASVSKPIVMLLVDELPALLASLEGADGQPLADLLRRVLTEGPAVGVVAAFTADRAAVVPARLTGGVATRLLFRQADPADFGAIGIRPSALPAFVPGRAVDATTRLVVQVPLVDDPAEECAALTRRFECRVGAPEPITALPRQVALEAVATRPGVGPALTMHLGVFDHDRSVAAVTLHPGEHFLVAGAARSGVSTTLGTLVDMVAGARSEQETVLVGVADERSPLRAHAHRFDALGRVDELTKVLEVACDGDGRNWVVLVDDAHLVEDPGPLATLGRAGPHCRLLVGGRADQLHGQFNHWTRLVRRPGLGLLLQPRLDTDGDLLGVRLPRRVHVPMVPGRGFVVSRGEASLIQVAADLPTL